MGNPSGSYRDLIVWQKSMELAKLLYLLTKGFPLAERYGLTSQIRRAVVSVPSNIAEGQARRRPKEFVQFLLIAKGSLAELDTQCILAHEFGYISKEQRASVTNRIEELQRMLHSLIGRLKNAE